MVGPVASMAIVAPEMPQKRCSTRALTKGTTQRQRHPLTAYQGPNSEQILWPTARLSTVIARGPLLCNGTRTGERTVEFAIESAIEFGTLPQNSILASTIEPFAVGGAARHAGREDGTAEFGCGAMLARGSHGHGRGCAPTETGWNAAFARDSLGLTPHFGAVLLTLVPASLARLRVHPP